MSDTDQIVDDQADALHEVGRSWWVVLVVGILSIILGAIFIAWPGQTILVFAFLLAIYLIVSGIVQIVQGFNRELGTGERVLSVVVGVISILLGVVCFRYELLAGVEILSLFIGIAFLFRGIWQLIIGIQAKGQPGRGLMIFSGILGIIVGFIFFVFPLASLGVLALIAGIWLIVLGLIEIFYAFRIKSATGN